MTPTRRQFIKRGALTVTAASLGGFAFTAPACGPSKEKAVRVAGFVIELSKEAVPLLDLLGSPDIAELMRTRVIPATEKLKDALANADIPTSESALATVRSVLSNVETALLNLAESDRRTTIIAILATVRMMLLTVESFIDSEMPVSARAMTTSRKSNAETIRKAFEVVRQ